jgi:hypothetical protein
MRGIFHLKTDEERQERQTKAAWKQYQASPAGQAAVAFKRGDAFFQIEISPASMSEWADFYKTWVQRPHVPTDVLGQIEAWGWRLEHASWVSDTSDMVTGIYLFRRNEGRNGHADEIPFLELQDDPRDQQQPEDEQCETQADPNAPNGARVQRGQDVDGCATGRHAAPSGDAQTIPS